MQAGGRMASPMMEYSITMVDAVVGRGGGGYSQLWQNNYILETPRRCFDHGVP